MLVGRANLWSSPWRVDEEATTQITFVISSRLGALTGTAAGYEGTFPLSPSWGGLLVLVPEPIEEHANTMTSRHAYPDQEGGFAFVNVPPGSYRLAALKLEEARLVRNPQFLRRKALAAPSVQIKANQITQIDIHQ